VNLSALSPRDRLALREWALEQRRKADFTEFCCAVDPNAATGYQSPHLRKIAEALERVESGECKRLFITAPPRHWKSSISSEKFPLWFLARNPSVSVILASHSAHLATGFSRNVRDAFLWNTNLHRLFPDVRVSPDYATSNDWALEAAHRSSFRAVGVGTGITGRGAGLLIIDDPVADEKEAFSKTQRDAVWSWYQNTARDRLDPGGAIVLIMSRWHADDLAGRLLKASLNGSGEPWEQLHLPALDPEGQALWPERYPVKELEKIKQAIGGSAWNAKYQGNPRPDDGSILDSSKLKMVDIDEVPALVKVVRRWDLAFSDREGSDYLSGAKVGIDAIGNRYIVDIFRQQGRWTEGKPCIIALAREDGPDCDVIIEANGTQLGYYQDINADQRMADRVVLPDRPEGNKEMRASVWGSRLEDGIIYCVRGAWNSEFFDQMDYFPNHEHDDDVDAVSGAMKHLAYGSVSLA
jgi:predicted phage terminase large subunit-like protein